MYRRWEVQGRKSLEQGLRKDCKAPPAGNRAVAIATVSAALLFYVTGCSDSQSPGGLPVSGQITLRGQPLDQGMIQFTSTMPNQGAFSGAVIQDGVYTIPPEGGLTAGNYEVRISSGAPGTQASEPVPGVPGTPLKDRIPAEYNRKTRQKVEIKPGAENSFNFHIP